MYVENRYNALADVGALKDIVHTLSIRFTYLSGVYDMIYIKLKRSSLKGHR